MFAHGSHKSVLAHFPPSNAVNPLGVAYLLQMKLTGKGRACSIFDPLVKPVIYTATGSALLLPPTSHSARPPQAGKLWYYPGWYASVFLQSS
ncbi:MAG TPA: hypothetical protein VF026_13940 [Ktedonobacteraceae bacterium]